MRRLMFTPPRRRRVSLTLKSADRSARQPGDLVPVSPGPGCRGDVRLLEDLLAGWQPDPHRYMFRATSTRFSRGMSTAGDPCIRSALPLLVLWIGANDHHGPGGDHLAGFRNGPFTECSDFSTDFLRAGCRPYFSRYVIDPG